MAEGTRAALENKKIKAALRNLKEGNENNSREIGEIRGSLKYLGDIKELIAAMNTKYDQMVSHIYRKQAYKHGQNGGSRVQRQEQHRQEQPEQRQEQTHEVHQEHLGALGFQVFGEMSNTNRLEHRPQSSFQFNQKFAKIEFPRFYAENPNDQM